MKKLVTILSIVLLSGLLWSQSSPAEEVIKIGVVSPASGNYADHGALERRGMQMAVEELNQAGGVLGKNLQLVAEDSETNPQVAARKARRLIEVDKVKYLMGGVSSSVAIAVGEVAQRYGVIFFATNQNSDTVTGKYAHRCVFRVPPNMAMALRALGPYILETVGNRWYFLTHDYSWGWSGTRWARNVLKAHNGVDVGESKVPLGTRDFSAFLIKARATKPDALVITVGGVDRAALMEQIYEFGIHKDMTVVHTLYDYEDAWAAGPKKNVGIHGTEWYYDIDKPDVREFVQKYKKRWLGVAIPVPTQDTANGYLATRELGRAIQRAGTENVAAVIKALEGHVIPESESLRHGPITIRDWDHQFICTYYVVRSKKPSEIRDRADLCEIVKWVPGEKTARTKAENPVKLEPYPE
ncbi:MAG: ABC transporter substrate-binding protein [Deltaproteobacteria bacterium]|nr:MAG: ABC transporter substrate-binding protein [Deltaproteobacteria bacterium]